MENLSEEEIIRIISKFLLSSPPGEFKEVLTDVKSILGDNPIVNKVIIACLKEYNEDQMVFDTIEELGYPVLVTEYSESQENPDYYLDPISGMMFRFDHFSAKFTGDKKEGEKGTELREVIGKEIQKYGETYFVEGASSVYDDEDNKIVICITGARFSPSNFWNGRWRSVWEMNGTPNTSTTLKGEIKVNTHYYEDGNVQLTTYKEFKADLQVTDPQTTAKKVVELIQNLENQFHESLVQNYIQMGDTTFKSLRKKLPYTGTKVDFANVLAHRIKTEISGDNSEKKTN
ncbi:f-actin-capping protein subunit alpha [Anaeramoeba ignava]|uniref:F-actin-capping protein subunit alpha n=1 Tax=Anaeramoeba ignava TaxID=1746090 RepID=A0A9Q0R7L4_ANAIG|nr:f-actin-capping protein subunit alpha [Anaeramoeba ignava]